MSLIVIGLETLSSTIFASLEISFSKFVKSAIKIEFKNIQSMLASSEDLVLKELRSLMAFLISS